MVSVAYELTAGVTPRSETAVASALRLAVMRLARRLRGERSDSSLTMSQIAALSTLERSGPLTPRELAAAIKRAHEALAANDEDACRKALEEAAAM